MERFNSNKVESHGRGFAKESIWRDCHSYTEWRIEIFQENSWQYLEWMPPFQDRQTALRVCVKGRPLGQSRVVGYTIHNNTIADEDHPEFVEYYEAMLEVNKIDAPTLDEYWAWRLENPDAPGPDADLMFS